MEKEQYSQMLQYLSGFPRQLFWPLLIFFLPLHKKKKWYLYLPVPMLLLSAAVGLGMLIIPLISFDSTTGPLYFSLYYCIVFVSYGIGLRLMTDASVKEIAYCLVCAYMAELMHYCLNSIGAHLLSNPFWWDTWYVKTLTGLVIYVPVYAGFARQICRDGHYPFSVLHSLSLFVFAMAIMFFLSIMLLNMELEWLHGVYTLLLCIMLMAEEVNNAQQLQLQDEARARERMEAAYRAQYELSKENIALLNRKSHDLRRQVAALYAVVEEVDAFFTHHALHFAVVGEEDLDLDAVGQVGLVDELVGLGEEAACVEGEDTADPTLGPSPRKGGELADDDVRQGLVLDGEGGGKGDAPLICLQEVTDNLLGGRIAESFVQITYELCSFHISSVFVKPAPTVSLVSGAMNMTLPVILF